MKSCEYGRMATMMTLILILGELTCPGAVETDQGAYSCEAINIKGSCFAGSAGCGQPGKPRFIFI
jgi:hypothetical protein